MTFFEGLGSVREQRTHVWNWGNLCEGKAINKSSSLAAERYRSVQAGWFAGAPAKPFDGPESHWGSRSDKRVPDELQNQLYIHFYIISEHKNNFTCPDSQTAVFVFTKAAKEVQHKLLDVRTFKKFYTYAPKFTSILHEVPMHDHENLTKFAIHGRPQRSQCNLRRSPENQQPKQKKRGWSKHQRWKAETLAQTICKKRENVHSFSLWPCAKCLIQSSKVKISYLEYQAYIDSIGRFQTQTKWRQVFSSWQRGAPTLLLLT